MEFSYIKEKQIFKRDPITYPTYAIMCQAPTQSVLDEYSVESDFSIETADLNLCTHLICNDKSYKNAQGTYASVILFILIEVMSVDIIYWAFTKQCLGNRQPFLTCN